MAEILLSLTIIGVVAAITLPSLTGNINERTWNTQRKALYARMSQAVALMPALNGFGNLSAAVDADEEAGTAAQDAVDTVAETFVTEGLAKVLKINNICDGDHLTDCGVASKINYANSNVDFPNDWENLNDKMLSVSYAGIGSYSMLNSKAAAFETQNGESIVAYYNPNCMSVDERTSGYLIPPLVCANFIYDLNGSKGPNTVGKDIGFLTVLYSSDSSVVNAYPVGNMKSPGIYSDAVKYCRELDNARLPNKEEAMALFVNKIFFPQLFSSQIYTGSLNGDYVIHIYTTQGVVGYVTKTNTGTQAQCVQRF